MTQDEYNEVAQKVDQEWYDEIAKRLPQIKVQSFIGAHATIRWLFAHVMIDPEAAKLAHKIRTLEKK